MGITREGRAAPSRSKNSRVTPAALREKRLKFTPPGRTVAPSGELRPRLSTTFATADDTSATWPWPIAAPLISSPFPQQLFRSRCHPVGLKAEFSLELLERRRSAKCLHA